MKEKPCVLIVDDVPENLKVLEAILLENDYSVRASISGKLAIKSALSAPPDLILLDINMPEMNGFEVCEKIKSTDSLKNIPVIFISAADDLSNILMAFSCGGVDYINKPFRAEEVLARVQTHLNNAQLQSELREKNEQLNQLNATKDRFFSIIAHDLKGPVSSWNSMLQILISRFERFSPEELKKNLGLIQQSSQSIYDLLLVLLDWSQTQSGRIAHNPQAIDLDALLKKNLDLLSNMIQKKGIKIVSKVPEKCAVWADENMTSTVIRNLLNNALKFSFPEGVIEISSIEKPDYVQIYVKDHGTGISNENLQKLFRIDGALKEIGTMQEKGTGLGLIICKEFIQTNKGEIGVDSTPGEGSTFYFTLPRHH